MCKLIQAEIRQRGLAAPAIERDQRGKTMTKQDLIGLTQAGEELADGMRVQAHLSTPGGMLC